MKRFLILPAIFIISITFISSCASSRTGGNSSNETALTGTAQQGEATETNLAKTDESPKATPGKTSDIFASFKKGDNYEKTIRPKIVKDGWQPAREEDADKCGSGDDTCDKFPEMNHCAGTGLGNCEFRWQKDGRILHVYTVDNPQLFDSYEIEKTNAVSKTANNFSGKYAYRYTEDYGGEASFVFKGKNTVSFEWAEEDVTWKGNGTWLWDEAKQTLTATIFVKPDTDENTTPKLEVFVFQKNGNDLKMINPPAGRDFFKDKVFQKR